MRCHKIKGEGGDVGPDLAGLGSRHDRDYILRSIIDPNAAIATGYETVMITLQDGNILVGTISGETADQLTLTQLGDATKRQIKKPAIKQRAVMPSSMPPGLGEILGRRDLRNVVEFLSTVK
jgi:quinoprotein glucose dehydrogenase